MYRLYRQKVFCTKNSTRIKTKGGAILRLTEAINHPGVYFILRVHLRSISPTYSKNCFGFATTRSYIIMFGNYVFGPRGSNPLSFHGGQVYIS